MRRRIVKIADLLELKGHSVPMIKPNETIATLSRRLQQARIGAMIVSEDGQTIDGIISERDVAYGLAIHRGVLHSLPAAALMTRNVITCSPTDSLAEVAKVMCEWHIRHLPVTDGKKLIGIIGMRDVFTHRLDELQRVSRLLGNYISAAQ